jgi:hypothetical protein
MSSWWDDLWGAALGNAILPGAGALAGAAASEGGDVSGAFSKISDTVSFSKLVWLNVSDYRMWRSLGWLLLGVVLLVLGFVAWNRKAIQSVGKLAAL